MLHIGEVEAVLKSLDPNKATGPDEIPARILKETATTIAPSLCKLFNRSLGEGYIPSEWKLANVVPVYKKDEKDHVENYRPISLLCIISKVLERCVLNRINDRLEDLIADCQHGFRSGRSCVTNLLETLDNIGAIVDSRGFNKFLHKRVLKSNRRVHLPKARRAFDPRGFRGHAPPENFEVLDSRRCIFMHFQVFFLLLCCFIFLLPSQLI